MSDENKTLSFVEKHQPALEDGKYTVHVEQSIEGETFTAAAEFHVAGPRFHIDPSNVHSMYPPPGSMGDHAHVLPHIILRRSTLPWEREAMEKTPWLALLLFDEGEIKDSGVKPLKALALKDASGGAVQADTEAGETEDDPVSYITVSSASLNNVLPTAVDLQLLTHVRRAPDGSELAVIVGNRLPKAGASSTAHLVSVETQYKNGLFSPTTSDVTLISLATWRFNCDPNRPRFKDQLKAVEIVQTQNHAPLRHRLRNGQRTISWYRSPFTPTPSGLDKRVDVAHADELLGTTEGLFDVTYSAAWELGRLLTLRNKHVASQLYLWKRRHAHSLHAVERQILHHGTEHTALPPDLPTAVLDWFDALRLLKAVPFHYLIPDESLLPPESIRFFQVDRRWLEQVQAGAFSIGHVPASTRAEHLPNTPSLVENPLCGFILRSAVVTQWPHLEIDASHDLLPQDGELPSKLNLVRREVTSPGILLCLFEGNLIRTLDFHQKPEALHYGFDVVGNVFTKRPRNSSGEEHDTLDMGPWLSVNRKLLVGKFKDALKTHALGYNQITSAEFALAMIEGVDRVRFVAKHQ